MKAPDLFIFLLLATPFTVFFSEASQPFSVKLPQSTLLSQGSPPALQGPSALEIATRLHRISIDKIPSHLSQVTAFESTLIPGVELTFHSPERWELGAGAIHWSAAIGIQSLSRSGELRYGGQVSQFVQFLYLVKTAFGGHWAPDALHSAPFKSALSLHLVPTLALTDRAPGDEGDIGLGLLGEVRPETQFFLNPNWSGVLALPLQIGRLSLSPEWIWSVALHTGVRFSL